MGSRSLLKTLILLFNDHMTGYIAIFLAGKQEFLKNGDLFGHVVVGHKI